MESLENLATSWRRDAEKLRRYGDDRGADVVDALARELEGALQDARRERLNLTQAAAVSGYSKRRLRELVAEGKLENRGEKGRPRFRRGDLPMKPRQERTEANAGDYDPAEDARTLAGRIGG